MKSRVKPILLCGPTASGKSALGIALARSTGGVIINADALQVYDCWRVLSARPSESDEMRAPHFLYGHVAAKTPYSVGAWLREVAQVLRNTSATPIILGGTGLYFSALTQGLTDIPTTPESVRMLGNEMRMESGGAGFISYLSDRDPETLDKTDKNNPMRLQRAWEVHRATGRGLASWQADTPPPLVALEESTAIVLDTNVNWLNSRIECRFSDMVNGGALDECRAAMQRGWNPTLPSSRALGATELVSYLRGELSLQEAQQRATIATRQFAKRQRTWFRNKMKLWQHVTIDNETDTRSLIDQILQYGNPT